MRYFNKKNRKKRRGGILSMIPFPGSSFGGKNTDYDHDPYRRPALFVTVLFSAVFMGLMGYFSVYAMTHQQELMDNSYNTRPRIFSGRIQRGIIYAGGGEILAVSKQAPDGSEKREYPYGELFAHSVGFTGRGKTGIEASENYYLIRSDIPEMEKAEMDVLGEKPPGDNVYTSLNVYLQEVASRALGIYKGAIIAMEPDTGRILAMVSKPDFDPGRIEELWEDLLADEESGRLVNRVTQGMYAPGSTFKIVTGLEYIRENPEAFDSYTYNCHGSFKQGEDVIRCYHGSVHGSVDMQDSYAVSCNASFANMGSSLNRDYFGRTLNKLYFNKPLPLDMVTSKSSAIVDDNTSDSDLLQTSIGQGRVQMSPLHLAMITSAVANNGKLMKPTLVDRIESPKGVILEEARPEALGEVMTPAEASALKGYLEAVVNEGTGRKLKGGSYTVSGKTGSAEYDSRTHDSHAWFTGFAPSEDPRIVVTVIIEGAGSGGDYAVPTAKMVFDAYFGR